MDLTVCAIRPGKAQIASGVINALDHSTILSPPKKEVFNGLRLSFFTLPLDETHTLIITNTSPNYYTNLVLSRGNPM